MAHYNLTYADTDKTVKEIIRGTSGTLGTLEFKITDDAGSVVNFTGMTAVAKIYIGVEDTLLVNGTALTSTTPTTGLATYTIAWADFANDTTEVGAFYVELYLADNASATKSITTTRAVLRVRPTIID